MAPTTGFLTPEAIPPQFVATDLEADLYICGPGPFMDLVESTLQALGVTSKERIFIERFLVEQQEKADALIVDASRGRRRSATR